ncbi:MAG TPA: hypothetical protein VKX17_19095 [Planctomycetota bacterium]|nr:hypothetical protein [Planctomycetota bacterium]
MSTIAEIEMAVTKLSPQELREFRSCFFQFDSDEWDKQIEADAAAGRLDNLFGQALKDIEAGDHTEL